MAKSLNLYLADNFEAQTNGKVAAMGMFTDRVVVLRVAEDLPPPSRAKPYGFPLSLLLNFAPTGPSDRRGMLQVMAPGQRAPVMQTEVVAEPVPPRSSFNIIVHLQPLLVPRAGRFQVRLTMGDDTLTAHFEVRIVPVPVPVPAAAAAEPQAAMAVAVKKSRRRAPAQ